MEPKTFIVKREIIDSDGNVIYRDEECRYVVRRPSRPMPDNETKDEIRRLISLGCKKTAIKKRYDLTTNMLNKILQFQPSFEELKVIADEATKEICKRFDGDLEKD